MNESRIIRKTCIIVIFLVCVITLCFALPILAAEPSSSAIGLISTSDHVSIGDDFTITGYLNPADEQVTAWKITPFSYHHPSHLVNCTLGGIMNPHLWMVSEFRSIDNDLGMVEVIQGFSTQAISTNTSLFEAEFKTRDVGILSLRLNDTRLQNSDSEWLTGFSIRNKTITIHPGSPQNISINSSVGTAHTLTWDVPTGKGIDTTIVIYGTHHIPHSPSDGTTLYNGTTTSCIHTNLPSNTTMYYAIFGWNLTAGLSSRESDTITITTAAIPEEPNDPNDEEPEDNGQSSSSYHPIIKDQQIDQEPKEHGSDHESVLEHYFNISLAEPFLYSDADGDGINETLVDPNQIIKTIRHIQVNDGNLYMVFANDDWERICLWNAETETILDEVTYTKGRIVSEHIDGFLQQITVTVEVEKANWTYIEISDTYHQLPVSVQTDTGRIISDDLLWRDDEHLYVLDDPSTVYHFIYTLIQPRFTWVLEKDTFFVGEQVEMTVIIQNKTSFPDNETITWYLKRNKDTISEETDDITSSDQSLFSKTWSTEDLSPGNYTVLVVYENGFNQTIQTTTTFMVLEPTDFFPWWSIIISCCLIIGIGLIVLYRKGFLNLR